MDISETRRFLTNLYYHLQRSGFALGVGELLAALQAVEGGWGAADLTELQQVAQLLWCHSLAEQAEFNLIWARVAPALLTQPTSSLPPQTGNQTPVEAEQPVIPPHIRPDPPQLPPQMPPEAKPAPPGLTAVPVQAPFSPIWQAEAPELHAYWPLSQREMTYAWRYLRRPVADGPADVLDITATVAQTVRQGFYLGPVYRRREQNHAHLLLLLDQNGSMTPFHRFTRDLRYTAQLVGGLHRMDAYFFHNVPSDHLYRDEHLTQPLTLEEALAEAQCDGDSSLLIVSDAGAARGYRRRERTRATLRFLQALQMYSAHLAWLNPVPATRWPGSSAEIIAEWAPMFQMDPDGVAHAIDVLRGQPYLP